MAQGVPNSRLLVDEVMKKALREAERSYKETNEFGVDALNALNQLFENVLMKAFQVLDNAKFMEFETRSGLRSVRSIFTSDDQYLLLDGVNHCKCEYFIFNVLQQQESLTCKHVLGAHLASICGKFERKLLTDGQMTDMLNSATPALFIT
ncbi:PREDICTED: zinc finger SWIM domain-containing protein 7-like [Nicrophorus vespilloides]|uniref:Zinc finger SWIM domain-containing protein 7-like n=1 Tax=Nicrophorus vespilloides TaxID=110193 RepID=A0ABM1M6Y7_NICVS|nr:PREDICTED: zinc finger SWIM domain-containing protein 7-like [Nicrophorus vespilloides]